MWAIVYSVCGVSALALELLLIWLIFKRIEDVRDELRELKGLGDEADQRGEISAGV